MERIKKVMKEICDKQAKKKDYYPILEEIYDHIAEHEQEPKEQRAESVKEIIDRI